MSTKYRPGSAGEKEQKQFRNVIAPFFAVVTIGVLLCTFVFNTEIKANVSASPNWMNILGAILEVGSLYWIWRAYKAGEEGAWGYTIAWAVCLAAGVFTSAGFYSYTY